MSHLNFIGGLKREAHHIKDTAEDGGYEPTLVILCHTQPGKSFMIPLQALWKYVDPSQHKGNEAVLQADLFDFQEIVMRASAQIRGVTRIISAYGTSRAAADLAACLFAESFSRATGIMLCTSYNLAKCMQMFGISPSFAAASQLLLFIQDGLDELRELPPAPEDERTCVGEAVVMINGQKVSQDVYRTETELAMEHMS